MSLLSEGIEIPFYSYFAYHTKTSKQPPEPETVSSRMLTDAIKYHQSYKGKLAIPASIKHIVDRDMFKDLIPDDCVAVPVPGRNPRRKEDLWVPLEICKEMVKQGVVSSFVELVVRKTPVKRSSTAGRGNRPPPIDHYNSFEVKRQLGIERFPILLVDDVITQGSTIAGATARILDVYPNANVSAFTLVRSMGLNNFEAVKRPVQGIVTAKEYSSNRNP